MTYEEACEKMRQCQCLSLEYYGRGENEMDLRVVVVEARTQRASGPVSTGNELLDGILGPGFSIEPDDDCGHFTLIFRHYIGFSMINESYDGSEENASDRNYRSHDESHFRTYLSSITFADGGDGYPGPFQHFEISCLNHVLNVACRDNPVIVVSTVKESGLG
jgi:hypothetical protein